MDVREKLVKLMLNADNDKNLGSYDLYELTHERTGLAEYFADYLISNGVTVQDVPDINVGNKWISVKDRLPQEDEPESTLCEQVQVLLDNGFVSTGWCNRHFKMWWHLNPRETHFIGFDYDHTPVIAWQPLAQPPKGE